MRKPGKENQILTALINTSDGLGTQTNPVAELPTDCEVTLSPFDKWTSTGIDLIHLAAATCRPVFEIQRLFPAFNRAFVSDVQ